ncbi:hypothetical protein HDU86_001771 [Geranomyces michiganensis]|nr:hypothetical protein HDU86_001771 [Geranomyces michiganensis]
MVIVGRAVLVEEEGVGGHGDRVAVVFVALSRYLRDAHVADRVEVSTPVLCIRPLLDFRFSQLRWDQWAPRFGDRPPSGAQAPTL